jgi:hypothetical protein
MVPRKSNKVNKMSAERVCSLSGLSLAVKVVKAQEGSKDTDVPSARKNPKENAGVPNVQLKKTEAKASRLYMYLARGGYVGAGGGGGAYPPEAPPAQP